MRSVCFIHKDITDIDRGGLCVLFKNLIVGFRDEGWNVSCISSRDLTIHGISIYKIPEIKDPLQYSEEVTKIIEKIKPDLAECSNWRFELLNYARKYGKETRKTKVVIRCDPPATTLFPELTEFSNYEKELCSKADLLIAVSKFSRDETNKQYGTSNVKVVYNGISLVKKTLLDKEITLSSGEYATDFYGDYKLLRGKKIDELIDPEKTNVFWVGKSTKMKGFDYLLKLIENSPSNFKYIINLGHARNGIEFPKTSYKNMLLIRDLDRSDQFRLWSKTNIFLATSRSEGLGIVVSEALSLGLPVILNNECVAYKEFLPNRAIKLLEIEDCDKVYEAISRMSKRRYALNNIPVRFTITEMIEKTTNYYESIL